MRSRTRQRGFSMIITFLLMIVMVGVATSVLIASQNDLQVSAVDRTSNEAFYMAETGVAYAKDRLFAAGGSKGAGAWNVILDPASPQYAAYASFRCVATLGPDKWRAPVVQQPALPNVGADYVEYSYCVHNNGDDPNCFLNCGGACNGVACRNPFADTHDGDGIITIEAFASVKTGQGPCDGVTVMCLDRRHITVDVSSGTPSAITQDYAQAGGSSKARRGDTNVDMTKFTNQGSF